MNPAPPDTPQPADGRRLLADALDSFLPPDKVSVADWAAEHRWVSGARAGRWDHSVAPYLVEPMQALTDPEVSDVVVPGPGQCGKTGIAENWLLASIATDPADFGWYLNTDDVRNGYMKDKFEKILLQHEPIRALLGRAATDNSLSFKRFRGMTAHFLSATASSVINKTFQRIVADEWDAYDPGFGDPKNVLDVRRQTYGRDGKMLAISHMDRAVGLDPAGWNDGIMKLYAASTRCTWWWKCPHCAATSSPNPGTTRHMPLVYPDDATPEQAAREAHLECPVCGVLIEDGERAAMNRTGQWIGRGQTIAEDGTVTGTRAANPIAGYWIVGTMSPFLLSGIGGLAAARASAEQAVERAHPGALKTLGAVLAKQWGMPLVLPKSVKATDAASVAERAEPGLRLGEVPEGVRFLITSIDVQTNRFELLTRGFGVGFESWVVDMRRVAADPATEPGDWDVLLRAALEAEYPLAGGGGRVMRVRAVGYDSGGKAGTTEQAYAVWRRARRRAAGSAWEHCHGLRFHGQVSGRDAWSLLALKGASSPKASRLVVTYPDGGRKDRHASARGEVPLGIFAGDMFKDSLQAQLARAEPGPPALHIPAALRGNWPDQPHMPDAPHPWFEQLFAELRSAGGHWDKVVKSAANEATDLMTMSHVMAHLHASRIDWARPPAWAAEWDRNALVGTPGAKAPARPEVEVQHPVVGIRVPKTPAGEVYPVVAPAAYNPASRRGGRSLASMLP